MNHQGKALKSLSVEQSPNKSKAVADGLAHYKDKCRNLESQLLTANKMHASLLKQNEALEKRIANLRAQIKKLGGMLKGNMEFSFKDQTVNSSTLGSELKHIEGASTFARDE